MVLSPGSATPEVSLADETGAIVHIPGEEWTLLWFSPIFGKYGCKSCQSSLLHELYPEFRITGCQPVAATFDSQEVRQRRNEPHVWRVPIVQVSHHQAEEWGAAREPSDSWYLYAPAPVSYLITPGGTVELALASPDHRTHAQDVLEYLRSVNSTAT